jgi:hypothetical protein
MPMNLDSFKASTGQDAPPASLPKPVLALWWAKKGEWEKAHEAAQSDKTRNGSWVHGYLHRVEGDLDNAAYWYGQGGQSPSTLPLDEEWEKIATALLATVPAA